MLECFMIKHRSLLKFFDNILYPSLFIFATILVLVEYVTRTNFVIETFKIDYVDFFFISIFLYGITLIKKPKMLYKNNWQKIVFVLPIFLFTCLAIIFMRWHSLYIFLEKEDSVIENLQFLLIIINSIFSFLLFNKWKQKNKFISIIFLIIAIIFLVIAGEEISWGQRIFHFETPADYVELNTQGETTLHNYGPVFGLVYRGYMLIGLVGSLSWIIKDLIYKKLSHFWQQLTSAFIPKWHYFLFFMTVFVYNYDRFYLRQRVGDALWEEAMELLLFFGISMFLVEKYFEVLKIESNKSINNSKSNTK